MNEKNNLKSKKGIFLTLPEPMLRKLEQEKQKFAYESVQEIIKETLRYKFFRNQHKGNSNRGRKKEGIDLMKVGSTKKIFK